MLTSHFLQSQPLCDLENGIKVTKKINQFLSLSQQYSCASLVKIHPFIQQIACRQAIIQQSEPSCDLENGFKVSKIKLFIFPGYNNLAVHVMLKSIHSFKRYSADKPFSNNLSPSVTLKMGSRSTKSNQFFPCHNNIDVQVRSKSIHSFMR